MPGSKDHDIQNDRDNNECAKDQRAAICHVIREAGERAGPL